MKALAQTDKKEKIAIAIDKPLLHRIDALIDGSNLTATMGLVNKENVKNCEVVLLDGSYIIDFEQNAPSPSSPPHQPKSHIINAGLYIFSPEIFRFFDKNIINLERDLFPKLAKTKQLLGYFTHGEYRHLTENERV